MQTGDGSNTSISIEGFIGCVGKFSTLERQPPQSAAGVNPKYLSLPKLLLIHVKHRTPTDDVRMIVNGT